MANGTLGELGRVEFVYQRGCFFGCSLEQPLLAGTRERIELSDAGDVHDVSVESSAKESRKLVSLLSCVR